MNVGKTKYCFLALGNQFPFSVSLGSKQAAFTCPTVDFSPRGFHRLCERLLGTLSDQHICLQSKLQDHAC